MKFIYGHYYVSLLLSGQMMLSSNALESSESCPPKYTSLLPSCALDQGLADTKVSECNDWERNGQAECPNLRPYLPHKFQMVKKNGKDYLRYSGGSANLPESGEAGGTFEMVGQRDISFDTVFCNTVIPPEERYFEDADDWLVPQVFFSISFIPPSEFVLISLLQNFKSQETFQRLYKPGLSGIKEDEPSFTLATDKYDESTGKPFPSTQALASNVAAAKNNGNNGNSNKDNQQRFYWDCESHDSILGLSPGFLDQYHHSLDGMDFNMSPYIDYLSEEECLDFFVVVTVNGQCKYWESNYDDNVAYRGIRVCKKGNGKSFNWHVDIIGEEEMLDGSTVSYDSNTCCWDPNGLDTQLYQPHLCGEDISNK
eukprot:scaffold284192_cov83-Cyclotella_meneghiniana.AAC.3